MNISNKAISPVIAAVLLLAISVILSTTVYTFIQDYIEDTKGSIEENKFGQIEVVGVYSGILYLNSKRDDAFTLLQIKDLNGNLICEIKDSKKSIIQDNTLLLLNLNSNSNDLSGYNVTVSQNGAINCSSSGITGLGCFTRASSDALLVPNSEFNLSGYNEITFSGWINGENFSHIPGLEAPAVFQHGTNSVNALSLRILGSSRIPYVIIGSHSNGIAENVVPSSPQLNTNQWYHLAMTFNGNTGDIKIYVDSELIHFETINPITSFVNAPGNTGIANTPDLVRDFNGTIDEVAFYSKEIDQQTINLLYESQKAKFYEQLVFNQPKEINISQCNLEEFQRYDFIGVFESGYQIKQKIESR